MNRVRVLAFGTYDTGVHPRIGTLVDGLRQHNVEVLECNAPLGLGTAARVAMLNRPWRSVRLVARIARRWLRLARAARRLPAPDAVLVGYLGHFDVHLARLLFRRTPIILDHLVGAADTARDRRVRGGLRYRLLHLIDTAALRAADVVLVDTDEHHAALPPEAHAKAVVVPVGAPPDWFAAAPTDLGADPAMPVRVVFFGLYTPLQGTPVIGTALHRIATERPDVAIEATMVGGGQDEDDTKAAAAGTPGLTWVDWVPADQLPELVGGHHVCLGIFGTTGKARRVVPNKVFQGAAAGCAIITSDTPPQRRSLGDSAIFVAPGDADALARELLRLVDDRSALHRMRTAAHQHAHRCFTPDRVVAPLVQALERVIGQPHLRCLTLGQSANERTKGSG